jgi:hypothetical protein
LLDDEKIKQLASRQAGIMNHNKMAKSAVITSADKKRRYTVCSL